MNKTIGIIAAAVVIISIAGLIISSNNKKAPVKRPAVQQKLPPERIKARNEALRYIGEAHRKAKQGDYNGAVAACDKASQAAPKEPIATNCKRRIEIMMKKH